jgi:hypothetical protein
MAATMATTTMTTKDDWGQHDVRGLEVIGENDDDDDDDADAAAPPVLILQIAVALEQEEEREAREMDTAKRRSDKISTKITKKNKDKEEEDAAGGEGAAIAAGNDECSQQVGCRNGSVCSCAASDK